MNFCKQVYFESEDKKDSLCTTCVISKEGRYSQITLINDTPVEERLCTNCESTIDIINLSDDENLQTKTFLFAAGVVPSPDIHINIIYKIDIKNPIIQEEADVLARAIASIQPIETDSLVYTDDLMLADNNLPLQPVIPNNYDLENVRLQTFVGWMNDAFVPHEMASAGFIYTGTGDKVKCPFCNIIKDDWNPFDHPLIVHFLWSSGCSFVRDKAEIINGLFRGTEINTRQQVLNEAQSRLNYDDNRSIGETQNLEGGIQEIVRQLNNESSQGSDDSMGIEDMGQLGELAWEEEVDSGNEDVDEVIQGAEEDMTLDQDDIPHDRACKVCLLREVQTIFNPCRHVACCKRCANLSSQCPVCRAYIKNYGRAYLP